MTDDKWRKQVYEPFLDAWKVIKLIQHGYKRQNDPELSKANDVVWDMYVKESIRLEKQYPGNPFVKDLCAMLANVGETIAGMNQTEYGDDL